MAGFRPARVGRLPTHDGPLIMDCHLAGDNATVTMVIKSLDKRQVIAYI